MGPIGNIAISVRFKSINLEYVLPSLLLMGGSGGLVANESCSWGGCSACKLTLLGGKDE